MKILQVLTSHDQLGNTGRKTGFWLEEGAAPYFVFRPYTIRVKVPRGVKLMPHRHPEDRIYTVISGVFYIGLGNEFEADTMEAYPPGAVIVLPGNTSHFHWAKSGEYISQVNAIGPLGIDYVNAKDDPRNGGR